MADTANQSQHAFLVHVDTSSQPYLMPPLLTQEKELKPRAQKVNSHKPGPFLEADLELRPQKFPETVLAVAGGRSQWALQSFIYSQVT